MQRYIQHLLFLITIITNVTQAQSQVAPAIEWQKNYGGSKAETGNCIKPTKDGGYIMCGSTESNDSNITNQKGNGDVWIVKLNSTGQIQWQKTYGGSNFEYAVHIEQTTDGGYIIAATTNSKDGDVVGYHYTPGNPQADYWILKIDSIGNTQWAKCFGGTNDDIPNSIIQTFDKGYIVVGYTMSTDFDVVGNHWIYPNLTGDSWIVKLDSLGNVQWKKCYGGSGEETAASIIQTKDSSYIFSGSTGSNDGDVVGKHQGGDVWLVKIDKQGNLLWQKCFESYGIESAKSLLLNNDGTFTIGAITSNTSILSDYWVIKTDSIGNIIWQKTYGGSQFELLYDISNTVDKGYIVIGTSDSNDSVVVGNHGTNDYWLIKLDSNGNKQWQKSLGGSLTDIGHSVLQTNDGGYICLGETFSSNGDITANYGDYDVWVIKLKNDTLLPITFFQFNSYLTSAEKPFVTNSWFIANDEDLEEFIIERSIDGNKFKNIGILPFISVSTFQYNFIDDNLPIDSKVLYYRIVVIKKNGNKIYSKINTVHKKQFVSTNVLIYPNPTINFVTVIGNNITSITVTNQLAQTLLCNNYNINFDKEKKINLSSFSKGVYYLRISFAIGTSIIKKIVLH